MCSTDEFPSAFHTSNHLKYYYKKTFPLSNLILYVFLTELQKTFSAPRCKVYRLLLSIDIQLILGSGNWKSETNRIQLIFTSIIEGVYEHNFR